MNYERTLFRYSRIFILLPVLVALALMIPLRHARINPDLNAYLPGELPARQNLARLEEAFGKYEPILVFFETDDVLKAPTLERLQGLSKALNRSPKFNRVASLFDTKNIRGEDGAMIVGPVVKRIPKSEAERERLREDIRGNELAYGLVVSEDFRYALLLANPAKGVADDEAVAMVKALLKQYPGEEKVYLNGMPYLKSEIQARTTRDMAILLPLGLLVMAVFLYMSFREKRGVLLPLSVVALSIILSMGLLPLFGWELSIIAILAPILMIAIANNYGIHIIARYQELNAWRPDWNMRQIVGHALWHLDKPILFTALTTIVGVLGLATHIMLPARQMGVVSAIGIAFALLLSLSFLPAILVNMKKGKVRSGFAEARHSWPGRLLGRLADVSTHHPRLVAGIFAAFLIILGLGLTRLQVSIHNENILPPKHPLRLSTAIANEHFGGIQHATLMWEGDLKDPAILRRMEAAAQQLEALPEVGKVVSLATVVRKMSEALNDPADPWHGRIPETREAVAQYLELYSMSGDPEDLEQLVDFDYTRASMAVQFRAGSLKQFRQAIGQMEAIVKQDPNCVLLGGQSLLEYGLATSVVRGQAYSLAFATVAIALLLFLIFRSVAAGLMGSLPLAFALICNFGLMGWLGIRLDIATSLLSSIAIGIGVDYTIHFFWRLRCELEGGLSYARAIQKTLFTTGRGITINAISVMLGFAVLFCSALSILKAFALLILFSLLLCLLCALVLIPALSIWLKPHFLTKNCKHEKEIHDGCRPRAAAIL